MRALLLLAKYAQFLCRTVFRCLVALAGWPILTNVSHAMVLFPLLYIQTTYSTQSELGFRFEGWVSQRGKV